MISLVRREDRRAHVAQLPALLGLPVRVVDAVDGRLVPPPVWWGGSDGAWGCKLSHLRLLSTAARNGRPLLVLEDDALPVDSFAARFGAFMRAVPDSWEAIMLGGEHTRSPVPVAEGVVRCVSTCRTHGYLLRRGAIAAAVKAAKAAANHWDGPLASALAQRGSTYAPDPFLIGTTRSPSDLPDSRPLP